MGGGRVVWQTMEEPETPGEDDLWGHPGVGASQDDGEGSRPATKALRWADPMKSPWREVPSLWQMFDKGH